MKEPVKRIVLSKWWVGDVVYHRMTGDRGLVTGVHFASDKLVPRYYVVFGEEVDGWCDEIELTSTKVYFLEEPKETGEAKK